MDVLIIEDEPATARRLEKLLGEIDEDLHVLTIIDTVEESINYFRENRPPELVFMDIHLADGNSFEIFERVEVRSPVIFTTAYDQYAIKAFKVNSIDYLLKPLKREELAAGIQKLRARKVSDQTDYSALLEMLKDNRKEYLRRFMVKIGQEIRTVNLPDVAYFMIENKSVNAILRNGRRYLTDFTLDQLENELDPTQFFRINRSMIISYPSISKMVSYSKSRIKIDLEPPYQEDVITSTERSGAFKAWLTDKS